MPETPHSLAPGFVAWLYGLPSSGKSTLAAAMTQWCTENGRPFLALDGDVLRSGICSDLGFSDEDRRENVRRAAHLAKLAMESGLCVIVSLITPLRGLRDLVESIIPADRLQIVAVDCPLLECQRRDVKGLYARAAAGQMSGMTGVDGAFEGPLEGDFKVATSVQSVEECREQILLRLASRGLL
jgi:adenylyl-sulfate kinase